MTAPVGRRAVADYARRPLNLVLLVAGSVALVFVWGPGLADFSKLSVGRSPPVERTHRVGDDPHLSPFHLASYVFIGLGFWAIATA